jgi:hypothetical protein
LNQNDVLEFVKKEVTRILPSSNIDWDTLGYQMDSLDRLEFVEHFSNELSFSLDILLMNPSAWISLESLSEFIFKIISQTLNE